MKQFKKILRYLLNSLPYLIVFLFTLFTPSDPDLGWHLKYGEYFVQHGSVLRDNTFSTMMANYHWANTGWLTDVITYVTYAAGGFLALSILGALVVTCTFFFFSRVAKLTLWDQAFLFPLLLYVEQPINAISFRGQQFTLLLTGVLFFLLSFYPKRPKVLLLTIPLFLLWANLHGQFIFGLALFAGWTGIYIVQQLISHISSLRAPKGARQSSTKSKSRSGLLRHTFFIPRNDVKSMGFLVTVLFSSILITILNPFGTGIHTAAISHFGSPLLKSIAEYLPFDIYSQPWWNQIAVGIGIFIGALAMFFKGKLSERLPLLGVSLIIFILSFGVRRYAWPAYYMILPFLQPLSNFLKPDNKKITTIMSAIFLTIIFGIGISSRFPFTQFTTYNWNDYCKSVFVQCSPNAAEYMLENNLTKNVYTLYGWGGWLIWNYPEIKPVIDGRMHLWHDKNGYSAFVDYYAYEQNTQDIDDSKYNIVLMSPNKPVYDRLEELVQKGKWDLRYSDKNAGVFVRNSKKE